MRRKLKCADKVFTAIKDAPPLYSVFFTSPVTVDDEIYLQESCDGQYTGREMLVDVVEILVEDVMRPDYRIATVRPWLIGDNLGRFIDD